jgi:hypothetical protein
MNTKAWRINEVSLLIHDDLSTDVPQSFRRFNYKVSTKLAWPKREKGCSQRELSYAETSRTNVVLLEFKQPFHLVVSTFVMKRKSGRKRRCKQAKLKLVSG